MSHRIRFLLSTLFMLALISVLLVPLADSLHQGVEVHSPELEKGRWLERGFSTQASSTSCDVSLTCPSGVRIKCCGHVPCNASNGQVSCGGTGTLRCDDFSNNCEGSCDDDFGQCIIDNCPFNLWCQLCQDQRDVCFNNCPSSIIGC